MIFRPLLNAKIVSKAIGASPSPVPADHLAIIEDWQHKTKFGGSETNLDGSFITGFLCPLLGYSEVNATGEWTLQKNTAVKGSGNVDVGIGHFRADGTSSLVAPFELKGPKTVDLDAIMPGRHKTPVQQAWGYAMDTKGAKWVLVSNMVEIRLYAVGYGRQSYEVFYLNALGTPKEYARFILLLSAKGLLWGETEKLLEQSELADKEITDRLYDDYKELRSNLIHGLKKSNPTLLVEDAIRFAQTILDRVLFIAFAEDTRLLPPRSLADAYLADSDYTKTSVWDRFVALFNWVDKGFPKRNIPPYNGGLFRQDPAIDGLVVPDALCEGFKKLGEYDFDSDISVNILGHIFEQSISDLEEIKARLDDTTYDAKTGKRKKDGVYYTPDYITRYIVEQAVGSWLEDRRNDLGFYSLPVLDPDKDYPTLNASKKIAKSAKLEGGTKKTKTHLAFWEAYKAVLSNIRVLDPACGSGAFLVQAFDYLVAEGARVNTEIARLKGGVQDILERLDSHVLKNNLFGVDLNPESVEITKLSLWLKTANNREKLTYLDNNIKCGNSLIDDPAVAGGTAFSWPQEFSDIMQAGGFDVVIGNPPYIPIEMLSEAHKDFFKSRFDVLERKYDSSVIFILHGLGLLNDRGYLSYISSVTWQTGENYPKLRRQLVEEHGIKTVVNLPFDIFPDAYVETCAYVLSKQKTSSYQIFCFEKNAAPAGLDSLDYQEVSTSAIRAPDFKLVLNPASNNLLERIRSLPGIEPLGQVTRSTQGLSASRYVLSAKRSAGDFPFFVEGKIDRYRMIPTVIQYTTMKDKESLRGFYSKGEKLLIRRIINRQDRIMVSFTDQEMVFTKDANPFILTSSDYDSKYLLAILCSRLLSFLYVHGSAIATKDDFRQTTLAELRALPILKVSPEQQKPFIERADLMLQSHKLLQEHSSKFLALVKNEFHLEKVGNKMELWYTMTFPEFVTELVRKKAPMQLKQKAEWLEHFETQKSTAIALRGAIDTADTEIDKLVYKLYGLSSQEIASVEGN